MFPSLLLVSAVVADDGTPVKDNERMADCGRSVVGNLGNQRVALNIRAALPHCGRDDPARRGIQWSTTTAPGTQAT